ncbi:MAG TPA: A/G-specific adenine glycosylase [Acidobacteriota bacterium]
MSEHAAATDHLEPPATLPVAVAAELIDWYRDVGRDLPWRRTRDPWAILVSEIMLQQTRVETVRGRYESFMERFPDVATMAGAPLEAVLAEWSGLGYYRRARSLHALARAIVERHGGEVPRSLEELLALPGLGPYTAAAVGSMCFGVPALAVDGNVGRALCRLAGIEDDFRRAPIRRRLEAYVADALSENPPGDLNQAIMELGARVCVPRSPRCGDCPVSGCCEARALGIEDLIPRSRRQRVDAVTELAAVIERDGRYLLFRGQRPSLVQDMWEFPTLDSRLASAVLPAGESSERPAAAVRTAGESSGRPAADTDGHSATSAGDRRRRSEASGQGDRAAAARRLRDHLEGLGWKVELGPRLGEIRHAMTHRLIHCHVFEGRIRSAAAVGAVAEPSPDPYATVDHGWFTPAEAARLPLAASARKTLAELLGEKLAPR